MELKKSKKVSLEKKKFLFLEIGLVVIAAVSLVAFEWTSSLDNGEELAEAPEREYTMEHAQVAPPEKAPQIEAPPKAFEQLAFKEAEENAIVPKTIFTITGATDFNGFNILDKEEDDPVIDVGFIESKDMPRFKGQEYNAFSKYIGQNLDYPQDALTDRISGRVFVQFTVNSQGQIVDASVVRGVDPSLDAEALRVINSSPKWTPGKQRGRPVSVRFTFPIAFVLQ